jgi:cell wall-associated NlpC family hydrolase
MKFEGVKRVAGFVLLIAAYAFPARAAAGSAPAGTATVLSPVDFMLNVGMQMHQTRFDCSHLVNYLYDLAGLDYDYAESRKLYQGSVKDFKRVMHPKAGDLVVWNGHVGIVVDPNEKSFLSALRTGVEVAKYDSSYWRRRGRPRFFHYIGQ